MAMTRRDFLKALAAGAGALAAVPRAASHAPTAAAAPRPVAEPPVSPYPRDMHPEGQPYTPPPRTTG